MTLRISSKNVDIGESLRTHVEARIDDAVDKYFDGNYSGNLVFEREGSGCRADCSIHLDTGIVLQASAQAQEPQSSFDQAAERIEKRLRRYKRKLKAHRAEPKGEASYVVFASSEEEDELPEDFNPVVIAETSTNMKTMTVGMAVMQLDLIESPVVVFRNAGNGGINVVYRRVDGHIGWVDPSLAGNGAAD
ncbi:ribosomal subunit interface protein [Rhodobium orientis]|uniref:Ribosome hibernation promoting factor n=1 Tax=Rhodobium orientis TaxID=34017 RepID=A0A327JPM4_9HYPH|nr:ribosome-associated translation inhibitor RaiA [Rhodobium orientis]MBB4303458.1 ribosomal subunit interface protein [Rhodobium orientis]MBK5950392.1 ribosomal subunit interface protein [Rhodobium orientis]RAI28409.1 ribosomal subunit interface protein [Rhodobium orientis]